jgi:hypothetical protein
LHATPNILRLHGATVARESMKGVGIYTPLAGATEHCHD